MLSDVDGVLVGHRTMNEAKTGCTVIVLPPGTVASGEIRGGAPATREFALLDPINLVENVDAVVLSGGSAFGLAASDGVMQWLEAQGRGFPTAGGVVPIVVGMSLFDLAFGDGSVRPGSVDGYAAADGARSGIHPIGLVGAGTGATTGKWLGREATKPGGIGTATIRVGTLVVSALIAVNAYGVINTDEALSLGPPVRSTEDETKSDGSAELAPEVFGNTTIGVVVTNAKLSKADCYRVAKVGHGGMARALTPAHTPYDGDALVAAATGEVDADPIYVQLLAQQVVERAIRSVADDAPHSRVGA